jgi:DNA-binding NtrC family response regulator
MDVRIDENAMSYLIRNNWRGNVRELENTIARACILSDYTMIKLTHLQDPSADGEPTVGSVSVEPVGSVKEMQMKLILDALKSMSGNRTKAASVLGITARTLRNKIREYREMGFAVP